MILVITAQSIYSLKSFRMKLAMRNPYSIYGVPTESKSS